MGDNPFDAAFPFLTRMKSVKGAVRATLLVEQLEEIMRADQFERIVDVGCGSAEVTCELVRRGLTRNAILIDPSSEMLTEARRTAECTDVSALCEFQQNDFESVIPTYPFKPYDMMICHAVLNWLPNPVQSLEVLLKTAKESDASVSLVLGSRFGHVLEQLTRGRFHDIESALESGMIQSESYPDRQLYLFDPISVHNRLLKDGFSVQLRAGIRVATDLLPDTENIEMRTLVALERALAQHQNLWHLGDLTHFIFRKE
jgi:S-adenosylmethionine-dependent methyltransferase